MALSLSSGHIRVRELVELVATSDDDQKSVREAVRQLYDWQRNQTLAAMQLSFAPMVAVVVAVVARPDSTILLSIALGLLSMALVLGVFQVATLTWLSREYVYALGLAMQLLPLRPALLGYPDGWRAPEGSAAFELHHGIGLVKMVAYRSDDHCREEVLSKIDRLHNARTSS
jgi:hypothetical protein